MADQLDEKDEEKLLECAICLNRLNAPRRLNCRHVFCFNCIKNHYKTCGKRLAPCPICRKLYPSINTTIEELPPCSIPLDQLLDMRNSRHLCESRFCRSNDAHAPFLCLKCKKWLCFECKERNEEAAQCSNHEAYRIANIDARLYNIVTRSQETQCVEHPSYQLQWFCKQCNILGCNYCKIRQPLNHTLIPVYEKARKLRGLFQDVCTVLKQKAKEHEEARDFFNEVSERLSTLGICNGDVCTKLANEHKDNILECKGLIQIITYLEQYASSEVLVAIYLNMEDQIASEIDKQPLNKLRDPQHWLRDTLVVSSEGKKTLQKLGNKRQTPTDTDLSKKINVTYYCNIVSSFIFAFIVIMAVVCLLGAFVYWNDIWQGTKTMFYETVTSLLRSRLDGMMNDILTPELQTKYNIFMEGILSSNVQLFDKQLSESMKVFKHYQHEYCHGNTVKPYSVYGGDVRFRYVLNISTFCNT